MIERTINAHTEPGVRVQAIGETEKRVCSYRVSSSVRTITVYLGKGSPGQQTLAIGPTRSRGNLFVRIGAQFEDARFRPLAERLATQAISRVSP